jgi:hypothetical protein
MPDELVVCFTLNQQSTRGASAVAYSALQQRRNPEGAATLTVWPLPMRVEAAETDRLELARAVARTRFSRLLGHLSASEQDLYWGEVEVFYYPVYAFDEVLAPFGDRPRQSRSLLASMEKLVGYLTRDESGGMIPMAEDQRIAGFRRFTTRPAADYIEDLKLIGEEYQWTRASMTEGDERTYLLTALTSRARLLAGTDGVASVAETLFKLNTDGARVIALALAVQEPRRTQIDMAIEGIGARRSRFEQYHALVLAEQLAPLLDPTAKEKLRDVIRAQIEGDQPTIRNRNGNRGTLAQRIMAVLERDRARPIWTSEPRALETHAVGTTHALMEIRPPSSYVQYADPNEKHGPWVRTRQTHTLQLPQCYRPRPGCGYECGLSRICTGRRLWTRGTLAGDRATPSSVTHGRR